MSAQQTESTTIQPSDNGSSATPKPNWRDVSAFGWPPGSVRALLAIIIFGGIWFWLAIHPQSEVPTYLTSLMFIIMGHYFASRGGGKITGPPPLYLPKGTVRLLLVAGFMVVGGYLYYHEQIIVRETGIPRMTHAGVTLILVGGFMLGVLRSRLFRKHPPRILEDIRALISLAAGALLILMVFDIIRAPVNSDLERFLLKYRTEDVLAALVGFYFGAKS